jgi:hypothetical protein
VYLRLKSAVTGAGALLKTKHVAVTVAVNHLLINSASLDSAALLKVGRSSKGGAVFVEQRRVRR